MKKVKYFLSGMEIASVDMKRMVNFFNGVFDAQLTPFYLGDFVLYRGQIGGMNVTLTPSEMLDIRADKSRYQLSFVVPNLERALHQTKRSGGIQMSEIDVDGSERFCNILDPDGNSIELVERVYESAY